MFCSLILPCLSLLLFPPLNMLLQALRSRSVVLVLIPFSGLTDHYHVMAALGRHSWFLTLSGALAIVSKFSNIFLKIPREKACFTDLPLSSPLAVLSALVQLFQECSTFLEKIVSFMRARSFSCFTHRCPHVLGDCRAYQ